MVSKWVPYDSDMPECEHIGGLGGWFGEQHTWSDYVKAIPQESVKCAESVRDLIAERWGVRPMGGFFHQGTDHNTDGVPIAACGGKAMFSFRAWGDICAAAVAYQDHQPHDYTEYAWT